MVSSISMVGSQPSRRRALAMLGLSFRLRDLIRKPTIGALLGIQSDAGTQRHAGLMQLNAGSAAFTAPLFCIHAGMGTVFDYQPLARALRGDRPVYGVPCRMLLDAGHCDETLEQMAKDYVAMIRKVQESGPYHLLGWSLGGTLVALMARILEESGDEVRFLGMVDPFVPGPDSRARQDDWQADLLDYLSVMFELADEAGPFLELKGQSAESENPSEALLAQQITMLMEKGFIRAIEASGVMDGAEHARTFMVARHLKALSTGLPALSQLRTRADCWWAQARSAEERRALWQQLAQIPESESDIPADHFSI